MTEATLLTVLLICWIVCGLAAFVLFIKSMLPFEHPSEVMFAITLGLIVCWMLAPLVLLSFVIWYIYDARTK